MSQPMTRGELLRLGRNSLIERILELQEEINGEREANARLSGLLTSTSDRCTLLEDQLTAVAVAL